MGKLTVEHAAVLMVSVLPVASMAMAFGLLLPPRDADSRRDGDDVVQQDVLMEQVEQVRAVAEPVQTPFR